MARGALWERLDFQGQTPSVVFESVDISAGQKKKKKGKTVFLSAWGLWGKAEHGGLHRPLALSPLGLQNGHSSEHPPRALNLTSCHTLRSGEGPHGCAGGWQGQDVILSLAELQRQAGGGEWGEEQRGHGDREPLSGSLLTWCPAAVGWGDMGLSLRDTAGPALGWGG